MDAIITILEQRNEMGFQGSDKNQWQTLNLQVQHKKQRTTQENMENVEKSACGDIFC